LAKPFDIESAVSLQTDVEIAALLGERFDPNRGSGGGTRRPIDNDCVEPVLRLDNIRETFQGRTRQAWGREALAVTLRVGLAGGSRETGHFAA